MGDIWDGWHLPRFLKSPVKLQQNTHCRLSWGSVRFVVSIIYSDRKITHWITILDWNVIEIWAIDVGDTTKTVCRVQRYFLKVSSKVWHQQFDWYSCMLYQIILIESFQTLSPDHLNNIHNNTKQNKTKKTPPPPPTTNQTNHIL